jgi:4-hydroxybenzoate polyprenyltransferase
MVNKIQQKPSNFSFTGFMQVTRFWNLMVIVMAQYFTAAFLLSSSHIVFEQSLFVLSLSTVLIAAAGYIINDYYDVKIDLINKPKRVVVGRILKRRVAMVAHTILNVVGIGLGLTLSIKIALLNFVCALLLWAYSNQLKRMVLIGNLAVAFLTGLSIYVVALFFDPMNIMVITYAIFAFAFTLIREIIKDIEDLKGDATFGCRTLPVVYGIRKTKNVIYVLSVLFLISLCGLTFHFIGIEMMYFCFGLIVPLGFLAYKLAKADKTSEFNYLSNYCKFVMLIGICSMILFY